MNVIGQMIRIPFVMYAFKGEVWVQLSHVFALGHLRKSTRSTCVFGTLF